MPAARIVWRVSPELRAFLLASRPEQVRQPVQRFLVAAGLRVLRNAAEQQIIRGGRFRSPGPPRRRPPTPPPGRPSPPPPPGAGSPTFEPLLIDELRRHLKLGS